MFGGGERKISTPAFERGDVFAMFGGFEIDLRKADMKGNRAIIDANCLFGGIVLKVPEDWNVTMRGLAIFGGYSDSTRHPRSGDVPFSKQLVVRGMAMFGGVEVKN
jgi:predicted membrane protein